jgi:hypothetical protein
MEKDDSIKLFYGGIRYGMFVKISFTTWNLLLGAEIVRVINISFRTFDRKIIL